MRQPGAAAARAALRLGVEGERFAAAEGQERRELRGSGARRAGGADDVSGGVGGADERREGGEGGGRRGVGARQHDRLTEARSELLEGPRRAAPARLRRARRVDDADGGADAEREGGGGAVDGGERGDERRVALVGHQQARRQPVGGGATAVERRPQRGAQRIGVARAIVADPLALVDARREPARAVARRGGEGVGGVGGARAREAGDDDDDGGGVGGGGRRLERGEGRGWRLEEGARARRRATRAVAAAAAARRQRQRPSTSPRDRPTALPEG